MFIIENEADLIAEHNAQKAAEAEAARIAEEAKQAAQQKEWEEKVRKDREAKNKRERSVWEGIAAALKVAGPKIADRVSIDENNRVKIGKWDVNYHVTIDQMWSSNGWGRYTTKGKNHGRGIIKVGDYGNKTKYPQKKDGSYSYDKIAQDVLYKYERAVAEAALQRKKMGNEEIVKNLREELNVKSYAYSNEIGFTASSVEELPVLVELKLQKAMTEEQARKLHAVMVEIGLAK